MAVTISDAAKAVMLDYFKVTVSEVSIGNSTAGVGNAQDTFVITWGSIGSGILDISTTYTDIITLRYAKYAPSTATLKSDRLYLKNSAHVPLLTMSFDDITVNPTTNGVYAIYSMPVTIAVV